MTFAGISIFVKFEHPLNAAPGIFSRPIVSLKSRLTFAFSFEYKALPIFFTVVSSIYPTTQTV